MTCRFCKFLAVILLFVFINPVFSIDLGNPKDIESIELIFTQSGNIEIIGDVNYLNLSLFIPQNFETIDVKSSGSWKYIYDKFGNKKILLEWENPKGNIDYEINVKVKNRMHYNKNLGRIADDSTYLSETNTIVITDKIREVAYPYEKTWENVARLTKFVYELVEYDISLSEEIKPSDWVLENKRGVCAEYTNLLAALLRASGIPTRYIVGYAYSQSENKFIGHTWVEILDTNGNLVSFDPTWFQSPVDATHIKMATLLDDNQTEVLAYYGSGNAIWKKKEDEFTVLNFVKKNPINISLKFQDSAENLYGYVKAILKNQNGCSLADLKMNPCTDRNGNPMLKIYEDIQRFWFCDETERFFFFKASGKEYICPVIVFDQSGSEARAEITVSSGKEISNIFISGPDVVNLNEEFTITANSNYDFIFYSPSFGKNDDKEWVILLKRPGTYTFYLYSRNNLALKNVTAVKEKEFSVLINAPENVKVGNKYSITIMIENLLNEQKNANLELKIGSKTYKEVVSLEPNEKKLLEFNVTADDVGVVKVFASASSNSISTYTTYVNVYKEKGFLEAIIDGIKNFFAGIINSIKSLFTGLSI